MEQKGTKSTMEKGKVMVIIGVLAVVGVSVWIFSSGKNNAQAPKDNIEPNSVTVEVNDKSDVEDQSKLAIVPSVVVSDQMIQDGMVTIDAVVSDGPGWVVIHNSEDGSPGLIVGQSPVVDGENANVMVEVDEAQATDELFAMLHTDTGEIGVYEFPGVDVPVENNGGIVNVPFDTTVEESVMEDTSEGIDVVEFDIGGTNYAFSEEEIRVQEGDTVRINFTSEEGFHDWVVDEFDGAMTEKLQAGESDTIEFVADQTGTFEYYCSVGSHREMGMIGTLIVE